MSKPTDEGYLLYVSTDKAKEQAEVSKRVKEPVKQKPAFLFGLPFPPFKEIPLFYACK